MRDEAGQLGGLEGLAFGVLVFVMGTLIVVNAWAVIDGKLAAASAAREAARAFVEANRDTADDEANKAAAAAIAGYGRDPQRMDVSHSATTFGRCERVTFTVEYKVSLTAVPLLKRPGTTFVAAARHSEIVDPFRSGLPGEARCVD